MKVPQQRRQQGAILITALLLLLVLTILGTSSLQNTVLQERMVGNMHNRNLAFQAAEAALRAGEGWLADPARVQLPTVDTPDPDTDDDTDFWWKEADADWWQTAGEESDFCADLDDCLVKENPRYLIEHHFFRPDSLRIGHEEATGRDYHRITTRGVGKSVKAQVVLQSVFVRRYER